MRIAYNGNLVDEPEIRAGFIGCGGHSFRNIYSTFQFTPVNLVATCDLQIEKAEAYAKKFGAERAYSDYHEMLQKEDLDAVFIVTNLDSNGRPYYPKIAIDCFNAGVHVWMEKPPASSCAEVEAMQKAAEKNGKIGLVGLKRMFVPACEKAKEVMESKYFGRPSLLTLQTAKYVPSGEAMARYVRGGEDSDQAGRFLNHFCHPISLLLFFLGMPETMYYERSDAGGGIATFTYASGAIASLVFLWQASNNGGMEKTVICSADNGHQIIVENNLHLAYHRGGTLDVEPFAHQPSFYMGDLNSTTAVWDPEFSQAQIYNKGMFLMGFWGEVDEFARAILEKRQPAKASFEHAWQSMRIFEAFGEGPGKVIHLDE